MFNPNITYHNTQSLILPQKSFGKKTLNNAYNTIAGLMAWRDAKKQAEKQEEALKKQEEWRENAYYDWQKRNGLLPQEIDGYQQISNMEALNELDDEELEEAAAQYEAEERERQRLIDEQERQYQEWLKQQQYANYSNMTSKF